MNSCPNCGMYSKKVINSDYDKNKRLVECRNCGAEYREILVDGSWEIDREQKTLGKFSE